MSFILRSDTHTDPKVNKTLDRMTRSAVSRMPIGETI